MTTVAEHTVRVCVTDVWDTVAIVVTPADTVADVKERGLHAATGRSVDPSRYVVKLRGALVLDENQTVASLDIPLGGSMIVLPAHRRPVR